MVICWWHEVNIQLCNIPLSLPWSLNLLSLTLPLPRPPLTTAAALPSFTVILRVSIMG